LDRSIHLWELFGSLFRRTLEKEDFNMDKLIITAAVTGSLVTTKQNPDLPITPEQIAKAAIESAEAGAAMVHLHVRDPESGRPVHDTALFSEVIGRIRAESDVVINISTGGGPGMSFDERIGVIPSLAAQADRKPEVASLNAGSVNFGILSQRTREFVMSTVQVNPWPELKRFSETMLKHGVKPEIEIYEAGMINNAMVLESIGALKAPLHFQFVLGVLGAMQPTAENLIFLKSCLPAKATWSVCSVGLDIFKIGPVAIASGGHVRVGLEDTVHLAPGIRARSNRKLVEKICEMANWMGRSLASPKHAREMLGL
jgi:3-keto-5-aminohexanoate cleavage enzyme